MNLFTPGKVILSGEHAIVHGRPALAMALPIGVRGHLVPAGDAVVRISAPPLPPVQLPLRGLPALLERLDERHRAFLRGSLDITGILDHPTDLLLAAAALGEPRRGFTLHLKSGLPMGSGLGSSAAVILTILKACQPETGPAGLQTLAQACEQFQHGRSSGLDVAACLGGGLVEGVPPSFRLSVLPAERPRFRLFHTGKPLSGTGECVARAGERHPGTDPVWDAFAPLPLRMKTALLEKDTAGFARAVRENHRLLCQIGVVPAPVREAVSRIERAGGAAKICGAGAVRGDTAGTVLVVGPDPLPLPDSWTLLHTV